jgi:hypothetical protein
VVVSESRERCERHDKYVKDGCRVKLKNVNLSLGETYREKSIKLLYNNII